MAPKRKGNCDPPLGTPVPLRISILKGFLSHSNVVAMMLDCCCLVVAVVVVVVSSSPSTEQ